MLTGIALGIAALAGALCAIIGIAAVCWVSSRWPGRVFQSLMLLIATASISYVVLSNRVLTVARRGLEADVPTTEAEVSVLVKLPLAVAVALSSALCIAWLVSVRDRRFLSGRRLGKAATGLVVAFVMHFVAFSIIPIFLGEKFYFHVSLIYPCIVFLALLLWVQVSDMDPVIIVKQCCFLIVFGSLVAAIVIPQLALQPGYGRGLISSFSSRLWGVTVHANVLASVVSTLFILELAEPARRWWVRWSVLTASVVALIMTQSKTSLLAVLLGAGVICMWRLVNHVRVESRASKAGTSDTALVLTVLVCCFLSAASVWWMIADNPLPATVLRQLNPRAVSDLATITGRTEIWEAAFRGGMENPLFGQGGGMWSLEARQRLGFTLAFHAHNLYLEVFSRAGFTGLTTLFILLYVLLRLSVRAAAVTQGGSLAVMTMFLMRSFTEVPLQPNSILPAEFFAQAGFLFYVLHRGSPSMFSEPALAGRDADVRHQLQPRSATQVYGHREKKPVIEGT